MHCLNQMLKLAFEELNININYISLLMYYTNIKQVSPRAKPSKDNAGL